MTEEKKLQQFSSFASSVDPSFWHKLCQLKLDVDKLEEKEHRIWGYYSHADSKGEFSVNVTAFNSSPEKQHHWLTAEGILINKNTIESFRDCDKDTLLQLRGATLEEVAESGAFIKYPSKLLSSFMVLSFADLKKYHFYYWFAFLAPKNVIINSVSNEGIIGATFTACQIENLETNLPAEPFFTLLINSSGSVTLLPLSEYNQSRKSCHAEEKVYLGFADPSNMENVPGWPLRLLLWLVAKTWPEITNAPIDILCLRLSTLPGSKISAKRSLILHLTIFLETNVRTQWVGWERNERGKLGPRIANLSSTMDPVKLAESSVDLNLKLMKWRLLPQMDLDIIKNSKCLLLGAGTLGCAVARVLMGWGVRKITFVDNGRVGYSNPVRQSLFKHQHCLAGGLPKATSAAASLKEIFPGVDSEGIALSIPMPGHSVTGTQINEVQKDVEKLETLINSHDVVFLLTDTRESRWLPSLLAKLHNKVAINAALGFDSFLVMRHGAQDNTGDATEGSSTSVSLTCSTKIIPGQQLGCYFCNDVVAPRNSMASRSLDQQCTVVRPGVAQIAAALAVELLVSVLQHPLKGSAPATCDPDQTSGDTTTSCILGVIPHSIRGFLAQFQLVQPASHAFARCAACSTMVLDEYRSRQFEFLLQAFNSPGYLEELTGLAALQQQSLDAEVWALSDSEDTD